MAIIDNFGRDGWAREDDTFIHLESEMAVAQQEDGHWYILDLEDVERSGPFDTPAQGMDAVDASYAENPRHSHNW